MRRICRPASRLSLVNPYSIAHGGRYAFAGTTAGHRDISLRPESTSTNTLHGPVAPSVCDSPQGFHTATRHAAAERRNAVVLLTVPAIIHTCPHPYPVGRTLYRAATTTCVVQ